MIRLSREECEALGGHCYESPGAVLAECKHCGSARVTIPQEAAA